MSNEPPFPGGEPRRRTWQPPERPRRASTSFDETTALGDEDALALSGPGAPQTASEHPVRARLLERARTSRAPEQPEARKPSPPLIHVGDIPVVSHHLDDESSATLLGSPRNSTPDHEISSSPASDPGESGSDSASRPLTESSPSHPDLIPASRASVAREQLTPAPPSVTEELERIARVEPRNAGSRNEPPSSRSPYAVLALHLFLGLSLLLGASLFVDRLYDKDSDPPDGELSPNPAPAVPAPPPTPMRTKLEGPPRLRSWMGPGRRVLSGRVGKEPFLKAIEAAGLPKGEAYRAFAALKSVRDLDHCGSSDTFEALVEGPNKRLIAFEYMVGPEEVYQAKSEAGGPLKGARLDLKVERNQIRRALVMQGSFDQSARLAGFDAGLGNVVEKALSGHLALRELKNGDRLRIVAQEVTVLGEFARYAGIEAIEIDRHGKTERFYYFPHASESGYFDASGRAPWEGGFRKPIPGAPVTSKFNMKRKHPILKKIIPHTGTDFGAPSGTPIHSTKAGKVTFIGNGGPSGNLVKVEHDGGYESGYAHLSRFMEGLKVGDSVDRLAIVGYCGSTGRSTGPHLHFTMRKNGQYIDPESLNLDGKRVLSPSAREPFAAVRAKYDPILDAMPWPEVQVAPDAAPVEVASQGDEELDMEGPQATASQSQPPKPASDTAPLPVPVPAPATAALAPAALAPAAQGAPRAALVPPALSPSAPLPGPSPVARPAPRTPSSAIFLSDSDLLKMQSATDEGEVPR